MSCSGSSCRTSPTTSASSVALLRAGCTGCAPAASSGIPSSPYEDWKVTEPHRLAVERPIVVALDFPRQEQAEALLAQLDPGQCRVKVGKELFTRAGPRWVRSLVERGHSVFLDLKFHDIPNTVADRKSTRLNSSHVAISYAVFCLKKKTDAVAHTHHGS